MGYKWRKKALLFKIETVYGTDAVPTGAANAVLGIDLDITPLDGNSVERGVETPYFGHLGEILVETHVKFRFHTELQSSGAAGTAPAWGPIMRASSAAEVISAGVSVTYNPITDNQEAATCYFYIGNTLHKIVGCRGTGRVVLNANQLPRIEWEFTGLYVPPTSAAPPAVTITAWQAPIPASKVNTPTFNVHGTALVAEGITVDFGNEVNGRFLIGQESVEVVDRKSVGQVIFESPSIATKDYFAAAVGRITDTISVIHGTVAGKIIEVAAPKVEIGRPAYSNGGKIVMMTVPLILKPNTGNDEWSLIAR